ncbi:hypothetical protein [Salipiger marinus]|jgi:hypothetical protein|uniref:Uncharacterized protein n=1 Tax=Salipiger marinus TaxID=555512 RepID=A0A1G8UZD7_9RHOB|nr:hypothetical protein [Salipiger marinus]SDJ59216.1 hypothetical protein SAMN04487993_10585 [Salipiger marinus]
MKRVIVEVSNLIPAHDVFIGDEFDEIENLVPVAFYAQVKIMTVEFPGSGLEQEVIAVPLDNFQDNLVGEDMEKYNYQNLVHLAKVQRSGD